MQTDSAGGSRARMIEAAIDLMRGAGLTGAGINEIVRASGAPKGSVYHFFPDGKLQIVAEALAVYSQRVQAFMEQSLARGRTPAEKVRELFDAFARRVEETQFRRSCAVGAISLDLDADLEALRTVLAAAFAEWIALIARHVDCGEARRTKSFASLVLTAIEGAHVRCRAERSSAPFRETGAWLAELADAPPTPARGRRTSGMGSRKTARR
ncbi:MAG: TetR/AcrR family transcriptional regulator [Gemmatimonadota bacterium]